MKRNTPQTFNDGVMTIYSVKNAAESGNLPQKEIEVKQGPFRYAEKVVGAMRHYQAMQANVRIDLRVRIPRYLGVSTQDICIPRDGEQYEIVQVQHVDALPPSTDLTLRRVEQKYVLAPLK